MGDNVEQPSDAQDSNVTENMEDSSAGNESAFEIGGKKYTEKQIQDYISSGLRQDDYTRKTQELANQRKEVEMLAKLAKEDPTRFLQLSGGEAKAKPEFDDPLEAELYDVKNSTQSLEQRMQDLMYKMELDRVSKDFPEVNNPGIQKYVNSLVSQGENVEDAVKAAIELQKEIGKSYLDSKKVDVTKTNAGGGSGVTTGHQEDYKLPRRKDGRVDWSKHRAAVQKALKNR